MCGIVGVFDCTGRRTPREPVLQAMLASLVHRGPDGSGLKMGPGYGIGHRRLSIVDLQGGAQPLHNESKRLWLTANGEIYNYRSLRKRLVALGHVFRTGSDCEAIVHAAEQWGADAPGELDGMFAYATVDEDEHRLELVRDRLGIKPLYWYQVDDQILFASEPKAILRHPDVQATLNTRAVRSYLNFRYVPGEETLFAGLKQLQPGHRLIADRSGVRLDQYWELSTEPATETTDVGVLVAETKEHLERVVSSHLQADVPVGAYLSGGVDSSAIVALMAKRKSTPVRTYTSGFAEAGYNEFEFARTVSQRYGTKHREIPLSTTRYFELMHELIRFKDAPLGVPNEVPLWQMSQALSRDVTVVLSGEGADELFGGYGRIFRSALDYERHVSGGSARFRSAFRAQYGDQTFATAFEFFRHRYNYFGDEGLRTLLASELSADLASHCPGEQTLAQAFEKTRHLDLTQQFMWVFQKHHLPGLLGRLDTTTMAAQVEGRVPFVDHKLVEFGHRIASQHRLRWKSDSQKREAQHLMADTISENYDTPKWVLREACRPLLPPAILQRKKVGFPVPLGHWLGTDLGDIARTVLLDDACKRRGLLQPSALEQAVSASGPQDWAQGMRIWMVVNLELFCSEYFDGHKASSRACA